jgi:hypothetical protein
MKHKLTCFVKDLNFQKICFPALMIIGFSFFINACQNEAPQYGKPQTTFFDLKGYFKTEVIRLKQYMTKVKKTVTVNGKSEEKILENLNFEEELAPFIASDINRPAWSDYYMSKVKEPSVNNGTWEYYALKDHLKTRSLIVNKEGQNSNIDILNAEETVATKSETRLNYDNRIGYTISTIQKLMGKADTIKVEVRFLQSQ